MNNIKKLPQSVIYIYRGTFDPFHNNHEAISRWCLSQPHTKELVIHINYRPTNLESTKQPASWETRFSIVQNVLKDNAIIRPKESFDETLDWITNTYSSTVEIVQVLGSDVLEQVTDKSQIKSYAQHLRINTDNNPAKLHNKPLLTIPLSLPSLSSTQIRLLLLEGRQNIVATMLSKDAIACIKKTSDYSPLSLSINQLKKNQFVISNRMAEKLAEKFGVNSFLEDKTQQLKGLSGDAIFSIKQNNKFIAMGKLFHLGIDACKKEISNHHLFSQYAKTPKIYFTDNNFVCMKYVNGRPPHSIDDYNRVGRAYLKLHKNALVQGKTKSSSQEILNLEYKIKALCQNLSGYVFLDEIVRIFDERLNAYKNLFYKKTTIHGDAQPGNVLIKNNVVIFIDFEKVKQAENPARDIHQMIASIYWKAWQEDKTNAANVLILKAHINAFLQGYSYRLTTEADKFWSFYWQVRTLILALEKPESALSLDIIVEFNLKFNQPSNPTQHMNRFFANSTLNSNPLIEHSSIKEINNGPLIK